MLSEVSQDQKHKSCMFSLIRGRDPKINIYKKQTYIQTQNQNMSIIVELLYGTQEKRMIEHNIRCEGRGYKDVY
jgi:hypothetical protein